MQLFYKEYPGPGKPLIIMHGLFGMLDNWHNLARKFSETYHVFLLDLRNHGNSPHSSQMNYSIMADDVWEFLQSQGLSAAYIMGHSMGGKVAMEFALKYPQKCLKLVVVDIAPVTYKPGHDTIFKALFELPIGEAGLSRKDLDQIMAKQIPEFGVRQFLLKSLARSEDETYYWKFNLKALFDNYSAILKELDGNRSYGGPTLLIGGSLSGYIRDEHQDKINTLFPNHQLTMIEGAGHWVHADRPNELIDKVTSFLV